jgi:nitrate reductase NapE component
MALAPANMQGFSNICYSYEFMRLVPIRRLHAWHIKRGIKPVRRGVLRILPPVHCAPRRKKNKKKKKKIKTEAFLSQSCPILSYPILSVPVLSGTLGFCLLPRPREPCDT